MYCPKCGLQQVSEEMRFCSRCGFQLSAVRELVAGDGAVAGRAAEAQAAQLSPSQRGVRRGARMMLAGLALSLVVGLLAAINDGIAVLLVLTILFFLLGFLRVLYNVFFAEKRRRRARGSAAQTHADAAATEQLGPAATRGTELPPARVAPVESFNGRRAETAEMSPPPSVTESATRLLE